ncbi:synaptonemal complex protein 2-like isoform X2 [Sebastes fasciatus]|uniref:synaptonemal complex protein 2-like isoform X2 n=1 Tax=Sebastes fasciatus TaxID=394691 RepID=UPI003D9F9D8A
MLMCQMEVRMEDCLLRGDSLHLVSVLHDEGLTSITLTRLDQLVSKELHGSGFSRVLVVMKSLEILSENTDDLQTLISHGLTAKVVLWFKAVYDLLTSDLQKSSALLSLTDEFYNYFQAVRTFNSILESLSRDQKRLIQIDQNQTLLLSQVAAAVLTVGDYELQVSLSEALCRLTPRKERELRANQWFSSRDISSAFCDIRDEDFEVDCRRFLNFVNGHHGDQRRVYTFACSRAFLDSTELFPPKDDNLDEFWIDFNEGSGCVSFFINEPQGFLWESIHLLKEDVDQYSLRRDECTGAETVLSVRLINPIMHQNSKGQTVVMNFNCGLHRELEDAAGRVFMKVKTSSRLKDPDVLVQVFPSAGRSYSKKKPRSKSQLKILPLSSPSSEDDSAVTKTSVSRAELLFDQIRTSTLTYDSGVLVGTDLEMSQEQMEEFGGHMSPIRKEVFSGDRKRAAPEPDQTEGLLAQKRRAELQPEGVESNSPPTESLPEGAEPPEEEEPVMEPESHLTSGITAAFNTFKTQLEQHFTGCWKNVETEILLSLKECRQHVSSLLTAVHHHRLESLQRFESSVSDQLKRLNQNSSSLNFINTQIQSFFKSEMQQLGSFCDEHLQRLKSLEGGESSTSPANDGGGEKSLSNQDEAL